ncbi:uncharacterized protein RJT20DRAFT_65379 [Scheffersomyces xylosifermentans]|uniref:uncharacterized protein n=1 Tax=Scheffersomyces xylosifermentans TaxID=1304137 RepID=UPI00315D410F
MGVPKLVILPCHAIWKGGASLGQNREEWHLVNFQIEGYDHLAFRDHIERSLNYLNGDPETFLVISGGQTKIESGPVSESLSYYQLAEKLVLEDAKHRDKHHLLSRITTEEFSRDSFENVLFSICRYYEVHGSYPAEIVVIGFEFKRERFLKYHLEKALRFPTSRVAYIGNAPDPKDLAELERKAYFEDLEKSEYNFAVKFFKDDWYGVRNPLAKKKSGRNPFNRYHGYGISNPELAEFLNAIRDGGEVKENEYIQSLLKNLPWVG